MWRAPPVALQSVDAGSCEERAELGRAIGDVGEAVSIGRGGERDSAVDETPK